MTKAELVARIAAEAASKAGRGFEVFRRCGHGSLKAVDKRIDLGTFVSVKRKLQRRQPADSKRLRSLVEGGRFRQPRH
jgi:hypothetical protein